MAKIQLQLQEYEHFPPCKGAKRDNKMQKNKKNTHPAVIGFHPTL